MSEELRKAYELKDTTDVICEKEVEIKSKKLYIFFATKKRHLERCLHQKSSN
jgi:hypothetical protein